MFRLLVLLSLAACTSTDTTTGSLTGLLDAELRDGTLTLSLELGNPDEIADGGPYQVDSISASFRGHSVPMPRGSDVQGYAAYSATLTPDPAVAADEVIAVTFSGGGDEVTLTATSTPEFELQAPASSPQPVTVTWSPTAADRIHWQSKSPSVPSADGAIETDSGQITFPQGVLSEGQPETVTIDVARSRSSAPRTALGKTSIVFNRWHTVMVEVTP